MILNKDGDVKYKIMDQYKKINQFRFNEDQEKLYINYKISHFYLEIVNSDREKHIFKYAKNEKILLEYRIFDRMKSVMHQIRHIFWKICQSCQKLISDPQHKQNLIKCKSILENQSQKKIPQFNNFIKVPFYEAYGSWFVFSGLNVILNRGMAYIYQDEIVKTVLNKYEETLIKAMIKLKNNEKFIEYQANDGEFQDMREKLKNFDFGGNPRTQISNCQYLIIYLRVISNINENKA